MDYNEDINPRAVNVDRIYDEDERPRTPTGDDDFMTPDTTPSNQEKTSYKETSLTDLHTDVLSDRVESLYKRLVENIGQTPDAIHTDLFEFRDGELYYKGKKKSLTSGGMLRAPGTIAEILGKKRLKSRGLIYRSEK